MILIHSIADFLFTSIFFVGKKGEIKQEGENCKNEITSATTPYLRQTSRLNFIFFFISGMIYILVMSGHNQNMAPTTQLSLYRSHHFFPNDKQIVVVFVF